MLCSKCQKAVATVHLTVTGIGEGLQNIDLCAACANFDDTGPPELRLVEALQMSVEGKKCEFCGADAITGASWGSRHIFYCVNCNVELSQELGTKMRAEHPEWLAKSSDPSSFEFYATD